MELSPRAIETLKAYRRRMGTVPVGLSMAEIARINQADRETEARSYALWAARRLVTVLRGNCPDPYRELCEADLWAFGVLRRRYLVKAEFIQVAYKEAVSLASKCSRSVN